MKIAKAIAILILGPLLGLLVASVAAGLVLGSNPQIAANGGHPAPGDGILIMIYLAISFLVSVPLSIAAAFYVLIGRKPSAERPI